MQKKSKNGIFDLILKDINSIQDSTKDIDRAVKEISVDMTFEPLFYKLGGIAEKIKESSSRLKMNAGVLIEEKDND